MMPKRATGGTAMSPAVTNYLATNSDPLGVAPNTPITGSGINASTGVGKSQTGLPALDAYLNSTESGASFVPPKVYVPPPAPAPVSPASTAAAAPAAATAPLDDLNIPSGNARGGNVRYARGGASRAPAGHVPILAAGGEFVVSPEHVARLGDGDVHEGHRRLDKWVVETRRSIIRKMSHLRPPVKS
jgi:hypothetical protein